ncbi:MAG TPA: histidine phosphatase family protein [Candidatus Angelobacter sp.]
MSRLFLVRHGQASFLEQNYDKLSPVGERQSQLLGNYWGHRPLAFQRIYTGPRTRQMETARIVGQEYKKAGLPWPEVQVMPEFDEYHGEWVMEASLDGLADSNPQVRELQQDFLRAGSVQEKYKTFQRLFEVVIGKWVAGEIEVEGVESWPEFCVRVNRGLSQVCSVNGGRENVAVFNSGGPIGVALQRALDLSPENTLKVAWMARNCSFSEFLFSGERFTLSSFNELPHLDDPSLVTYR